MSFSWGKQLLVCVLSGLGTLVGGGDLNAIYPLDDNGNDIIANRNNLSLREATFSSGFLGKALQLDGSKVWPVLDAQAMRTLINDNGFSISFLCRPTKQGKSYCIVLAQATRYSTDRSFWIGYLPNYGRFDFLVRGADNQVQAQVHGINNAEPDQWNLVIASAGDGELRLMTIPLTSSSFRGRITQVPFSGKIRNAEVPLTLGGRSNETESSRFKGEIDDLIFWNRPLSSAEMVAIFTYYQKKKQIGPGFHLSEAVKESGSFQETELPYFSPGNPTHFQMQELQLNAADQTEYIVPKQIASGNFQMDAVFVVPDWKQSMIQFDLGADSFIFDGKESSLRNTGKHEGISSFKLHPLNVDIHNRIADGRPVHFSIQKEAGVISLRLDEHEVYRIPFPRDTIGEIAVSAKQGAVDLKSLGIDASMLFRKFVPVFTSGENGTATYRIPALVGLKDSSLLAFAEARHHDARDLGDIDLVCKRSMDGGRTWSPIQTISQNLRGTELSNVNPCPVVDSESGRVHLFFYQGLKNDWGKGKYRFLHFFSDDNGLTWSNPIDLKPQLPKRWLGFQPGPGHGVILRHGKFKGRIVIPGWYVYQDGKEKKFASALVYSDDNGKNFQGGGTGMEDSDECQLVELADGSLLMSIRTQPRVPDSEFRHFAVSRDGGRTFSPVEVDMELRAPICQAGVISSEDGKKIYFSYPASGNYERNGESNRAGMTLRYRAFNEKKWSAPLLIYAGRSGYSDLAFFGNGRLGILFEGGRHSYTDEILFTSLDWKEK